MRLTSRRKAREPVLPGLCSPESCGDLARFVLVFFFLFIIAPHLETNVLAFSRPLLLLLQ